MAYWEHEEKKEDPMDVLLKAFAGGGGESPAGSSEVDETMAADMVEQQMPFDLNNMPEGQLQLLMQLLQR